MPRQKSTGKRKPMSPEVRQKISSTLREKEEVKVQKARQKEARKRLDVVKMREQRFPDGLFECMRTDKIVDELFSATVGFPKATIYMFIGDPGVGKTTVALDILSEFHRKGLKVLYVSSEMTRIDMKQYVDRFPKFNDLSMLFLGEYMDDDPKSVLEEALDEGYDFVVVDSFAEAQAFAREGNDMSSNEAEKWLISLMSSHTLGNNKRGKNTSFLACQQVTKGGIFVGSNRVKHNTTGMLEARYTQDEEGRVLYTTKNRRGKMLVPIWYSIDEGGDVTYSNDGTFKTPDETDGRPTSKSVGETEVNPFKIREK